MERQQTAKPTKTNPTSRNNLQAKIAARKRAPLHPVLQLQRKIGNQAVNRLLSPGGIQANLKISQPGDKYEQEAEPEAKASTEAVVNGTHRSPTFRIDAGLDTSRTLQRKTIPTWGGTFDNDLQYDLKNVYNDKTKEGSYGAHIQIRFTPNAKVRADKIALVQTAATTWNGSPWYLGNPREREVAEARSIPAGVSGEGIHIDQPNPSSRTPLAGMKDPPKGSSELAASVPVYAKFGVPSAKDPADRQAWLHDPAAAGPVPKDVAASQSLETAALAVSGAQQGAYYGSVRWGWVKAADQTEAKLQEFSLVSPDAPSSNFTRAAKIWNAASTNTKEPTIDLPTVTGQFIGSNVTLMERAGGGKGLGSLAFNTRVELTGQSDPAHKDWSNIVVVDGRLSGKFGWVKTTVLSDWKRKKSL